MKKYSEFFIFFMKCFLFKYSREFNWIVFGLLYVMLLRNKDKM